MNQSENANRPVEGRPSQPSVIDLSKRARQKLRARQYPEAKELFRQGLALEPENPYLLSGMGDVCREIGDFNEAAKCYRLLLEVDDRNLFALRGLGDVYKKLDRHQEAMSLWEKYLLIRPQDKHVMTRIADSCKILMQFDRAEQVYLQILKIAPRDRFALTGLADLQHRLGKDDEAINTYERVLRFDENELHILTIIGKLCWRISDFDRAERYFRRALKVDPKNPYALYGLGNCYRWHRRYDKAIEIWQEILLDSEGTQALHTRMGDAFYHLGRLTEAQSSYRQALTFGVDPFAVAGLICLHCERYEPEEAFRFLQVLTAGGAETATRIEMLVKRFVRSDRHGALIEFFRFLLDRNDLDETVRGEVEQQLQRQTG